ncbi:MAG: FKBP-type peptidyl-prolyl cis-trans isomerase [Vallitaleaceae bacterium]|jgi:FKBP-type peptidyl-prolyl cis-trans isomerase FklB|nr:FKBP-type peptidyl-prolyl cis-trans isomerase [Vallitaleaceae bacterium]
MRRIKNLLLVGLVVLTALFSSCSKDYYDTKTAGEDFLQQNAKREVVTVLPSGIQYEIIFDNPAGSYPQFAEASEITIKAIYSVRFINDSVYTESPYVQVIELSDRPDNFWLEVIPKMRVGAKWRCWVPYDYAYGEEGQDVSKTGYDIDPYTVLVYDIELTHAQ